ncbi:FH2 domain containing protein 1 [Dissostichus eleginoides]|uniref:FH2 domain containing protein 1 n=1 Tax=Dissostichus eleginoides TaxID=100907 RepID=A0AAD9BT51_DISEL|nr:FH2 domain containing protein 1 [Dissostichus eleginoides]
MNFVTRKRSSKSAIVEDIHHGNSERLGAGPLRELMKLLPEKEEVEKLRGYHGDVSKLSLADSFVHLLIQLPSYSLRIESLLLKEEFPAACEAMTRDLKTLRSAGNILNAGGYAGNAVGFKLSSLLSLADTKANKPGMNLLHFVALEAQKKDTKLLEFPQKLHHVQPAARISLETLDAELQFQTSRTRSITRQQLKQEGSDLLDFFCEDREAFRLDDCFNIFNSFCCRFTQAAKENAERESKEALRRRRLQDLEEQKRHSWAGGEEVGGAFGLRCSSETDMSSAVYATKTPGYYWTS